jgi:hypothetical protein
LARLSQLLRGNHDWAGTLDSGANLSDNPHIPAGYTYLLQLVGHDVVHTSVPLWAADPAFGSANLRMRPLQLETLYGGTPAITPLAYRATPPDATARTRFQLGRFTGLSGGGCPYRDLMRIPSPQADPFPSNSVPPAEVLVADPRNDDNAILAQLAMLFMSLHNAAVDRMERLAGAQGHLPPARAGAVFAAARLAVVRSYHAIVRNDLLPRILHPHVRAACERSRGQTLWQGGAIPLEFSAGAMRAGHAMARNAYLLPGSATLAANLAAKRAPQDPFWALQWSLFFRLRDDVTPNHSRRIGPGMSSTLFDRQIFPPIDATAEQGGNLPHRDLKTAALAGLWSVPSLIARIQATAPDLIPADWPFADPVTCRRALHAWLDARNVAHGGKLAQQELAWLAGDLPLPVFILAEAALDPAVRGAHFGVLGSIIVADVLTRLLDERWAIDEASGDADLPDTGVPAIQSMADCVRFLAAEHFPGAQPPFI